MGTAMKSFSRAISQDVEDLFTLFEKHQVNYLLVGAYAVMVYTDPRFTKDVELWIEAAAANSHCVTAALREFGAPLTGLSEGDFSEPGFFYTMGIPPGRIDLLMSLGTVDFTAAFSRRKFVPIGKCSVPLIAILDLIQAKQDANRPQDLLDLERLKQSVDI